MKRPAERRSPLVCRGLTKLKRSYRRLRLGIDARPAATWRRGTGASVIGGLAREMASTQAWLKPGFAT